MDAIDHPVWRLVESVVGDDGDTIRRLLARIADPVDGQILCTDHVCPFCKSNNWRSWEGDRVGNADVPGVSFEGFNRLPENERKQRIGRHRSEA